MSNIEDAITAVEMELSQKSWATVKQAARIGDRVTAIRSDWATMPACENAAEFDSRCASFLDRIWRAMDAF